MIKRSSSENDIDKKSAFQYEEFRQKYKPPSYSEFIIKNPNAKKRERIQAIINFYRFIYNFK
jgi:hypothetical protein